MSPQAPFLAPERDGAFKRGRPKKSGTSYISLPGVSPISVATGAPADFNADCYSPLFTETPILVDQLLAEVTTLSSGKNFRIGLYVADTDWQPVGAPLADSGNISMTTTGVKTYTPGSPVLIPRGRFLSVINSGDDVGVSAFRVVRGVPAGGHIFDTIGSSPLAGIFYVTRTLAAFPTPGTAWTTTVASTTPHTHMVFLRVSSP